MVWQMRDQGEITESIAFALALTFCLPFSAQKIACQAPDHLSHYQTTTSEWHFSYAQTAILDIEIKTGELQFTSKANSFR
jgi:hypothetical protein